MRQRGISGRSAASPRVTCIHPVPAQLTSLIGRERDLEEVGASLSSARLLTLTGAGGVGKTRLAVEAAARAAADFPDGVWWIELAALADPGAVAPTLVQALGVRAAARPERARRGCRLPATSGARCWCSTTASTWPTRWRARGRGAAARVSVADDPGDQPRPARDPRGDALGRCRRCAGGPDAARLFIDRARRVDRALA